MSVDPDDLNLLVFHYLKESGFQHSAFTFFREGISNSRHRDAAVGPGWLLRIVQMGLRYLEIEAHIDLVGAEIPCTNPFTLVGPHRCNALHSAGRIFGEGAAHRASPDFELPIKRRIFTPRFDKPSKSPPAGVPAGWFVCGLANSKRFGGRERPYEVATVEDAIVLLGHHSEVYVCQWNPMFQAQLATGAYDGGGRVWRLPTSPGHPISSNYLGCGEGGTGRDIIAMDWHPRGTVLALGSYDGSVAQYTHDGWLRFKAAVHGAPVLSRRDGRRRALWCSSVGDQRQVFRWHSGPVVSVDWKDMRVFATGSVDGVVYVGDALSPEPVGCFAGHRGAVNFVSWEPHGRVLATCSDDTSVKIWAMGEMLPLRDLRGHGDSVSCIRWAPNLDPAMRVPILASASDDTTVCLWDVTAGSLLFRLAEHAVRVASITFSPGGDYLASGAFDAIHVFSTKVFDVEWSPDGRVLAACFADASVTTFMALAKLQVGIFAVDATSPTPGRGVGVDLYITLGAWVVVIEGGLLALVLSGRRGLVSDPYASPLAKPCVVGSNFDSHSAYEVKARAVIRLLNLANPTSGPLKFCKVEGAILNPANKANLKLNLRYSPAIPFRP
ncbi:hypothetical protein L0F63_000376 [Massospora cicadina]|nr:hypothetical protein L0F63_000376 [Massospora cicadina]